MRKADNPSTPGALDSLGCPLSKLKDHGQIVGDFMTFYRRTAEPAATCRVETPAAKRGLLIGLSTTDGHRRRVFEGRRATEHAFSRNTVYVRDFSERYKADLQGSFDFLLLEVTSAALARIAHSDRALVGDLSPGLYEPDLVLAGLLGALLTTTGEPGDKSALFVDQLSVAIGIHLLRGYDRGKAAEPGRGYALSSRRIALVMDMIDSRLSGDLAIDDLASACGLSSAVFLPAFRAATGTTPHQWLIRRRVGKACDLLLNSDVSLAEIARRCGFADQSHFTRIFAREFGAPPGQWRRRQRS